MSRWNITVAGKGVRKAGVEKLAEKLRSELGEGVGVSVTDATPPESRGDRFRAALDKVGEARSEMEELRDELQEWHDNLPENFQQGEKGEALQSAIDALDEVINNMEDLEGSDVEFPGMFS